MNERKDQYKKELFDINKIMFYVLILVFIFAVIYYLTRIYQIGGDESIPLSQSAVFNELRGHQETLLKTFEADWKTLTADLTETEEMLDELLNKGTREPIDPDKKAKMIEDLQLKREELLKEQERMLERQKELQERNKQLMEDLKDRQDDFQDQRKNQLNDLKDQQQRAKELREQQKERLREMRERTF